MVTGLTQSGRALIQSDRALAIADVISRADPQDVILVAGKGHETEQEIMGIRYPFSDVQQAQAALQQRAEFSLGAAV
jgi:UDP-N-acetylmuramoyl-L-alanyl-D-glutamate--2,6-diaminopimelate ligase